MIDHCEICGRKFKQFQSPETHTCPKSVQRQIDADVEVEGEDPNPLILDLADVKDPKEEE